MGNGPQMVGSWLRECAVLFDERQAELDQLDAVLGDGDHGTNMRRGLEAARDLHATDAATAADALRRVGMALVSNVGGASGPLFGTFFLRCASSWPPAPGTEGIAAALRAALQGIVARGRAQRGDKTMVDALQPAVESLVTSANSGEDFTTAVSKATAAAEAGRDETRDMIARRGRAALLAEHSVGTLDPGAVSMALILCTAAKHID